MSLESKAAALVAAGFDPVLIRPTGCPRKPLPHVCANCAVGTVWVTNPNR